MHPPHLPPETCNIETHRRMQRLKILLAAAIFGLVAGASGASMMLGWIWPRFAEGDTWITSQTRPAFSKLQLEDRVMQEMSQRVASVYQGVGVAGGVNFLKGKLGDAITVGSDGWLAIYLPNYDGRKDFYALTYDGNVFQPEKTVYDKYSRVLFFKIKGGQFKVVTFGDVVKSLDDVFLFSDGNWVHTNVLYPQFIKDAPGLDTAPRLVFSLNGSFAPGQIAVNSQGRIAGVVDRGGALLTGDYISRILPQLLSFQTVTYPSLGVEGWFSEEQPIVSSTNVIGGFAVTKVLAPNGVFRRGDIIKELDGRVVSVFNLWYIINAKQSVNATILRLGKELEIIAPIIKQK